MWGRGGVASVEEAALRGEAVEVVEVCYLGSHAAVAPTTMPVTHAVTQTTTQTTMKKEEKGGWTCPACEHVNTASRERVCGVSDGAQPGEEDEGGEQGEDGG